MIRDHPLAYLALHGILLPLVTSELHQRCRQDRDQAVASLLKEVLAEGFRISSTHDMEIDNENEERKSGLDISNTSATSIRFSTDSMNTEDDKGEDGDNDDNTEENSVSDMYTMDSCNGFASFLKDGSKTNGLLIGEVESSKRKQLGLLVVKLCNNILDRWKKSI